MSEILLLGTFHFSESSIDFYSSEVQKELQGIVQKLALFNPDAVAVEAAIHQQKVIDESYAKFHLSDLLDRSVMETKVLGKITMFGSEGPLTYNNETIQIGFRLSRMLGLQKVYAIDEDSSMDMSVLDNPPDSFVEHLNSLSADTSKHDNDCVKDLYKYCNGDEFTRLNHQLYLIANSINEDGKYRGAQMVTEWYERNLKIFCNIQQLAKTNKRIFVVYGGGHLQILRELINASKDLKLVDINQYL